MFHFSTQTKFSGWQAPFPNLFARSRGLALSGHFNSAPKISCGVFSWQETRWSLSISSVQWWELACALKRPPSLHSERHLLIEMSHFWDDNFVHPFHSSRAHLKLACRAHSVTYCANRRETLDKFLFWINICSLVSFDQFQHARSSQNGLCDQRIFNPTPNLCGSVSNWKRCEHIFQHLARNWKSVYHEKSCHHGAMKHIKTRVWWPPKKRQSNHTTHSKLSLFGQSNQVSCIMRCIVCQEEQS